MGSCISSRSSNSVLPLSSSAYELKGKSKINYENRSNPEEISEITCVTSFPNQNTVEVQVNLLDNIPELRLMEGPSFSGSFEKRHMFGKPRPQDATREHTHNAVSRNSMDTYYMSSGASSSSSGMKKCNDGSSIPQRSPLNDNYTTAKPPIDPNSSNFIAKQSFNSLHSPNTDDDYSLSNGFASTESFIYDSENTNQKYSINRPHVIQVDNATISPSPAPALSSFDESPSTISSGDESAQVNFSKVAEDPSNRNVSMKTTVRASFTNDGKKMVNEYVILKKIGSGSYGKVKLVADKNSNHLYAMKICDRTVLQKMKRDKRGRPIKSTEMDNLKKEVAILKKVEHPNVVKLFEVIDDASCDKVYMVFEYVEGGAVLDQSSNPDFSGFPEHVCKRYFRDLLKGLQYLHDHKVIHRDIKPENLLVDKNGTLKLTDFGVSIMFRGDDDLLKTSAGTPSFLPPEACRTGKYRGKPFDIWCSGVTLYVLLYGSVPFTGEGIMGIYHAIVNEEPKYPENINDDLRDIFSKLLEKKPSKRITLEELMIHPWVTDHGQNPIKNEYISPQAISHDDIENAIAPGETLKLIDKFVLMSKLQAKFLKKLSQTRDKLEKKRQDEERRKALEGNIDEETPSTQSTSGNYTYDIPSEVILRSSISNQDSSSVHQDFSENHAIIA